MEVMPQDGFTVGTDSHRYPKLMIAYGSKDSQGTLQQPLQDWYERYNETFRQELPCRVDQQEGEMDEVFPQELPGRVDPQEGGKYGDQLPLNKPRAKTLDITSGAGLPIQEGCSSMDVECVQDGQPDTGNV